MASLTWVVSYEVSGTSYTLDDVQSISYESGRRWTTDPYQAGRGQVVLRDPSSWTAPKPAVGRTIYVYTQSVLSGFLGKITDVEIRYGEVPAMDEAIITFEGPIGSIGRNQLNSYSFTEEPALFQAAETAIDSDVTTVAKYGTTSTASAQTYTGNALSIFNEQMLTEVGRVGEAFDNGTNTLAVALYGRLAYSSVNTVLLSDVPADWTATPNYWKYKEIEFKSAAENYFTKVTIQPQAVAQQTSGTGKYALVQESVDVSTTQALQHAEYLKSQYGGQTITPYSVTLDYVSQVTALTSFRQELLSSYVNSATSPTGVYTMVATPVELKFRGTTYYGVVEGYKVTATPANTQVTLYFSPQDQNDYLYWNGANPYGNWDENKWSF